MPYAKVRQRAKEVKDKIIQVEGAKLQARLAALPDETWTKLMKQRASGTEYELAGLYCWLYCWLYEAKVQILQRPFLRARIASHELLHILYFVIMML